MKKILKINFNRCFSTSLLVNRTKPFFWFYRILSLENRLYRVLLPYYKTDGFYNIKISSIYDDAEEETVLHSDIISKSQIPDFDLYIKSLVRIINEILFDFYPEGTKMSNVMILLYVEEIKFNSDGNKIPEGKRYYSTSNRINRMNPKPTISFKYRGNKEFLEQRLKEIILSYYNMNYGFNVLITYVTHKGNLTLQLHSDIISKLKVSNLDSYITEVTDKIYEAILENFSDKRGVETNRKGKINLYIDVIKYFGDISSKIPSGKRNFSTYPQVIPVNDSQKFFIYKHDILYLENKLEEILALYYHDDYTYKLLIYYDNSILLDDSYLMKDFIPDFDEYIKILAKLIFERVAEEVPNDNAIITIYVSGEEKTDKGLKHFIDTLLNSGYTKPASKRHFSTNMDNTSASETKAKDVVKTNKYKGYTKPSQVFVYPENGIEYGRNFGKWKCLNCENVWTSAYTWISTDFCLKNKLRFKNKNGEWWYSGIKLRSKDFFLEDCKNCASSNTIIKSYHKLKFNENDHNTPHVTSLCAKCKKGYPCQDAWID